MAKPILPDSVWWLVEPLLPANSGRSGSGRRPIADRRTLTGILYVLLIGVPWDQLPYELGCGAGMTCLRRLRRWQQLGAWDRIQQLLLEKLPNASAMDWSRVNVQRKRAGLENQQPIAIERSSEAAAANPLRRPLGAPLGADQEFFEGLSNSSAKMSGGH